MPDAEYLPHRTVAERIARGRALRKQLPPGRLARWSPSAQRTDPIAILERQGAHRAPELVPIRYGRMLTSPFAFFRGGAAIMASDLAGTPVGGLTSQLCGDAHLLNFGLFETPERTLVFGLNDFDETLPGPVEWDVKRLAASIEVAGRDLGFTSKQREAAVTAAARAYREAMLDFAGQRNLEVWYARLPAAELRDRLATLADRKSGKEVARRLAKALRHDHLGAFERHLEHGRRHAPVRVEPTVPRARGRAPRGRGPRALRRGRPGVPHPVPREPQPRIDARCSSRTGSSPWPGRWSGSAASGPGRGWC